MKYNFVSIGGGVLSIISAFLPWVSGGGQSYNGFQNPTGSTAGIFFVVLGVLIALFGYLNKKWSHIVNILLSLIVLFLGVKYLRDAGEFKGFGLYIMLLSAVLGIIGSVMGLRKKPAKV